jgi:hypothetical protein
VVLLGADALDMPGLDLVAGGIISSISAGSRTV